MRITHGLCGCWLEDGWQDTASCRSEGEQEEEGGGGGSAGILLTTTTTWSGLVRMFSRPWKIWTALAVIFFWFANSYSASLLAQLVWLACSSWLADRTVKGTERGRERGRAGLLSPLNMEESRAESRRGFSSPPLWQGPVDHYHYLLTSQWNCINRDCCHAVFLHRHRVSEAAHTQLESN